MSKLLYILIAEIVLRVSTVLIKARFCFHKYDIKHEENYLECLNPEILISELRKQELRTEDYLESFPFCNEYD